MSIAPPAASSRVNLLAVIPARKGSKRLPGKNWRLFGGKPLVLWTIEAATRSSRLTQVLLSTDSPVIADLARGAGLDVPFLRPSSLATDSAKTVDVVKHSVDFVETRGPKVSSIVTLQPTSPLRSTTDIDAAIDVHLQDTTRSVVSVSPVHPSAGLWMFIEGDTLVPVTGSWPKVGNREAREAYALNGAIFVTPRKVLEAGDLVGPRPRPYIMPRERSVDIDDELDWQIAETLIR
jgi:CMP-N,N'-diacetyllegionaminic acid synthase